MKYSDGKDYKVIALCMAKFDGYDQTDFIQSFFEVCNRHNFKLQIFSSLTDFYLEFFTDPGEEQIYDLMEPDKYDAVLIFTSTFKKDGIAEKIANRVLRTGTPCFSLESPIEGCINVCYDFVDSFEKVVRHMVEVHKPKHINFIAGQKGNSFSEERLAVYKKVLEENNIPIEEDRIGYGDFWDGPTRKVVADFLASGKPIDAIICANDLMAMEVCRQLFNAGIRVPEDIIVSGFDGIEMERYHYPRLATCETNLDEFTEKIGNLIDDICDGYPIDNEHLIGCKFRPGQSCGCAKIETTREVLFRMGTECFNANRHEKALTTHMESLYEKIPALGNKETLAEVWQPLVHFVSDYIGGDFFIALNNDFLGEDMEIWPNIRPMALTETHHYYTDKLIVPFQYRNREFSGGFTIRKSNLIPDLYDYFDKGCILLFLPLHAQGSTIGYAAQGFIPDYFEYFMLYSMIMNLRNILEMHKYRIDQVNLYSTDQLTKLLNRKGFYRHMESKISQAVKDNIPMGVISIDMNWLKQINDTYGHKEGDFALAKIGSILESSIGVNGVSTRFGGDEFAAAFIDDEADAEAKRILNEITAKLDEFNASGKKPYPITISKGYVVHTPDSRSNTLERFIVEADRKMYADKARFKETHHWEGKQEE